MNKEIPFNDLNCIRDAFKNKIGKIIDIVQKGR